MDRWKKALFNDCLFALCLAPALIATPAETVGVSRSAAGLTFAGNPHAEAMTLVVSGPPGEVRQTFPGAGPAVFEVMEHDLPDGLYTWELTVSPRLDPAARQALREARGSGDRSAVERLTAVGRLPATPHILSGYFRISGGSLVAGEGQEEGRPPEVPLGSFPTAASGSGRGEAPRALVGADQVFNDDLIVQRSACIGLFCVNGESFGVDTLRLKEDNTRLLFLDTSSTANFPTRDWQLVANDRAIGGADRFSLEDIDSGRVPFTVEGSAPDHTLYLASSGRVGIGTATPSEELQIKSGDSPALRLEQDGSQGFNPHTWDVAGNETNFFIYDVTAGSFPLRIEPYAPHSALYLQRTGNLGLGTTNPAAHLDVSYAGGSEIGLQLKDSRGTEAPRDMMRMINNGRIRWEMEDTSANGVTWTVFTAEDKLNISSSSTTGQELQLFGASGNLTIRGQLNTGSDRESKRDVVAADPQSVLDSALKLPLHFWSYREDAAGVRHLGPMAQDFHALFGLGADGRHLAPGDTAGVALVSVQALAQRLQDKERRLEVLEAQNRALEERLRRLEDRWE